MDEIDFKKLHNLLSKMDARPRPEIAVEKDIIVTPEPAPRNESLPDLKTIIKKIKCDEFFVEGDLVDLNEFVRSATINAPDTISSRVVRAEYNRIRDLRTLLELAQKVYETLPAHTKAFTVMGRCISRSLKIIRSSEFIAANEFEAPSGPGHPPLEFRSFYLAAVAKLFLLKVPTTRARTETKILDKCGKLVAELTPLFSRIGLKKNAVSAASLRGYIRRFSGDKLVDIDANGFRAYSSKVGDDIVVEKCTPKGSSTTERAARLLGVQICYLSRRNGGMPLS